MFARVSTIKGSSQKLDEAIRDYREGTLPAIKKMPGFKGAYLLVDRKSGTSVSTTLWETEKDLQASMAAANPLRAKAAKILGSGQPPQVDIYEVVVSDLRP